MKMISYAVAVLALLGPLSLPAVSAKQPRPPKPEELVGTWIGFWEDEEFTRLELWPDFTGYCAYVAPVEDITHQYGVHVYRVTHWTLDGWKLDISLTPINSSDESIYLKGRLANLSLQLEVGGLARKWKEHVVLHKESRIQTSNLETKTKIEDVEKK